MSHEDKQRDQNSRRRFLGKLAVTGSAGLMAGCSGDGDNPADSPGEQNDTGAGDTESGGSQQKVVIGDSDIPGSLDPHAFNPSNTPAMYAFPENGYETLLAYPPRKDNVELVPLLATEVPDADNGLISEDGLTIEFPLREGVTFHTGGEMTAEDVRYSFDRAMTMGLTAGSSTMNENIESMEVVDDYTFRLTLTTPNAPVFLNSVITQSVANIVSKAAVEENGGFSEGQPNQWMAQNSAGTGPFVLGDRQSNSLVWNAHDEYWGEVNIDEVEQFGLGTSARISRLSRGDAHYIWISQGSFNQVRNMDGVEITKGAQFNPGGLVFNANIPYDRDNVDQIAGDDTVPSDFFADRSVRRAFGYVMDFQSFIEDTIGEELAVQTRMYQPPGTLGFDESAPSWWEQDLDMAEELLKDAGYWEEGFRVTVHNEQNSEFNKLALELKDSMEGLNSRITINSVREPEGPAVERHNQDPPGWPLEAHALLPLGADPHPYYEFFAHNDGAMGSRTGIPDVINEEIPQLIEDVATERSTERRIEMFQQLQRLTFEDPPSIAAYAPQIASPHLECVDTNWSTTWRRPKLKHWDFSGCF